MTEKLRQIDKYQISYEEDTSSLSNLTKSEISQFQDLLIQAIQEPKKTYAQALSWQKKHPQVPALDNLVAYLHLRNRKIAKAEKAIVDSYLRYPDYLIAKINYADQCLRHKKWKKIPSIFPSFDLQELFPEKKFFHVTEFRGFMMVAANYYLNTKNLPLAQKYYELAALADPDHPSVLFCKRKILKKGFFVSLLRKIVNLVRIS